MGVPKVAKRLEFERVAQPKSRTERQRAERRDGAEVANKPTERQRAERRDGAEAANKPNGIPARRKAGRCEEGGGTAKL